MTGVLFFEVFEVERWEITWILGWRHGVAEVIVELEVLGCNGEGEQHDSQNKDILFHKICFYMNVLESRAEVRKPCGNLP